MKCQVLFSRKKKKKKRKENMTSLSSAEFAFSVLSVNICCISNIRDVLNCLLH